MSLSSRIRSGLKRWSLAMAGPDLEARLEATRPAGEFGVDAFGYDPDYALSAVAPLVWLYKHYFRVETHGLARVPPGRVLLIPNHSGQLPFDGAMIGIALLTEARPARVIRGMVDQWVATLPYVSTTYARIGQIVGTPENCRRLLERDEAILAFPEGMKAIVKPFSQRYQLQRFGLGFMRLALETGTPIVPVGVIGAEEQAPALVDLKVVARALGLPSLPLTAWGAPLPLPTKYHLHFGEPLTFHGRHDDEDAELERKVEVVKEALSKLLEQGLAERKGVFW
jgi:1-acyl-sn-glycerol-3-phosphate acyltransferase